MSAFVQSYGLQIVDHSGKPYDSRQLTSADVIAFYFSASWCHACKHFTPQLKKFHQTLTSYGESSLKIIFISSDQSEHDMWKYMYDAHGEWLALAYSCRDGKGRLERQYQVTGIPQLVVIDPVGRQAVRDARAEVLTAVSTSSTSVLTTYLSWKSLSGSSPPQQPQQQNDHAQLPCGVQVKVRGLTGAPERNGQCGVIKGYDDCRHRYNVQIDGKQLGLRAANLLQMLQVRISGDQDEWLEAEIADFDDDTGEFTLVRDAGEDKGIVEIRARLGDANGPVLLEGARVVVHSLQGEKAKEWNEHVGKVLDFDKTAGRYLVQVAPSTQLKLRPDNMRLVPLC